VANCQLFRPLGAIEVGQVSGDVRSQRGQCVSWVCISDFHGTFAAIVMHNDDDSRVSTSADADCPGVPNDQAGSGMWFCRQRVQQYTHRRAPLLTH
jgi:hypothetical protein